jgi:DNA-directed RNA polymerase subunit L
MDKSKIDIKTKVIKYVKVNAYQESELQMIFSGKSIDRTIVNALRRVALQEVPTYAFHPSMIKITANDTVRNNDMLRKDYLCQICIPDLKHDVIYLPRRYWEDIEYTEMKKEDRYEKDNLDIVIVVSAHNDTTDNMFVMTHEHVKYYENGELKDKFTKEESELIAELRPNEALYFTAKAVVGVNAETNKGGGIFAAARQAFIERLDEEGTKEISEEDVDYKLVINSLGQLTELEILKRACIILNKKLDDIKIKIMDALKSYVEIKDRIKIKIDNESHTLGNLLEYVIQGHSKVIGCAYTKPDHLVESILLTIEVAGDKDDIVKIINQSIDYLKNVFDYLLAEFKKIKEV